MFYYVVLKRGKINNYALLFLAISLSKVSLLLESPYQCHLPKSKNDTAYL